jgi:hypothetical protein
MLLAVLTFACSDYNVRGPTAKPEGARDPEDTGEPEPEPEDEPDIEVSPETIDFEYQLVDCPSDPIEVTVTNKGLAKLKVSDIELVGDAASRFEHDGAPVDLDYLESYTFDVTFTPTSRADFEVDLEVTSNDPDEGTVGVPTLGTGSDGSTYEESFLQEAYESVDVLWVVDNSGSMEESVGKLKADFDAFMNVFTALGLDFHLGVVTTDMDNPSMKGLLQGSPNYIDSTYGDPVGWFGDTANVGSGGSGDERGLDAAYTAMTDPLKSSDNAGFLRSDSAIAVIVVSDEDDSSSMSSGTYTKWFESLRSDTSMTTFNSIVGDSGLGCFENWVEASAGTKYIEITDATGGAFLSICSADFEDAVTTISQASAGLDVVFALSETPSDISQMEVVVDGATVAYDSAAGWSYDATYNSIEFHGDAVPQSGELIEVSYPVAGTCN